MQSIVGFFSGSSIGYFTASFFSGADEGVAGKIGPWLLSLGDWQLHLHHWLVALGFLLVIVLFVRKKYQMSSVVFIFTLGFLIGLIFQGIYCYDDWHNILIKKQ